MAVETYSHVMHIVSSVSGTLRAGVDADGRAARVAARGHALGRAEDPRDADHRRARARQARPVRRRGRLPLLHRRPRHLHLHPLGAREGRRAHIQAGGGIVADSDAGLRGARDGGQGGRRDGGDRAGLRAGGVGHDERPGRRQLRLASPTTSSSTWASSGRRSRWCATTPRASTSCSSARPTAVDRLARARARRTRPGCRWTRSGASPRPACRCWASASATRRWRRRSAARVVRGEPVHGKTAEVEHDGRTIFDGPREPARGRPLPLAGRRPRRCPTELEVSARGGGVIMGIRHRELPVEGVQFHPESVLTPHGKRCCGTSSRER